MFSLTIEGTGGESHAGIPNYITITPSSPATIYYTIDDSEPTIENAFIYVNPIPIDSSLIILNVKVFAITSDGDVSDMFTRTFVEDEETITYGKYRKGPSAVLQPGVIIDTPPHSIPPDIVKGWDIDGNPKVYQDEPDDDYEIVKQNSEIITVVCSPYNILTEEENNWRESNLADNNFNPRARVINIDIDNPRNQINLIMRPFGSMRDSTKVDLGSEMYELEGTYVSGGFMRRMYNHDTGRMTSYYFDSNSLQYVLLERSLENNEFGINLSGIKTGRAKTIGFVFQWMWPGRGNMFG